jgi:glycerate kinase
MGPIVTLSKAYRFGTGAACGVGAAVLSLSAAELAGGWSLLWDTGLFLPAVSLWLLLQGK